VIIHKLKPHLIDLEDTIKWPTRTLTDTMIFRVHISSCDNLCRSNAQFNFKRNPRALNLQCGVSPGTNRYSSTVLYNYPAGGNVARQTRANYQPELQAGFDQVINMISVLVTRRRTGSTRSATTLSDHAR